MASLFFFYSALGGGGRVAIILERRSDSGTWFVVLIVYATFLSRSALRILLVPYRLDQTKQSNSTRKPCRVYRRSGRVWPQTGRCCIHISPISGQAAGLFSDRFRYCCIHSAKINTQATGFFSDRFDTAAAFFFFSFSRTSYSCSYCCTENK